MKVTHTRATIIEFINDGEPEMVAAFLRKSKKLTNDMQDFYGPELNMNVLINSFKSGSREDHKDIRDFLGRYFDVRDKKFPIQHIPGEVRRKASLNEAKDEFEKAKHSLTRGSVTKGMIDLTAASLSAAGLTREERQKLVTGTATVGMIGMTVISTAHNNSDTRDQALSALDSFNQQSYSQTLTGPEITSPLSITIDVDDRMSAYEGEHQFSPYLIKKLDASANARQYMKWIIDAAEQNGIDPVLFGNQLFRESVHFSESVIRGDKDSHAGAKGIAQFIKTTGEKYGLHSDADFYDPQKAIYAAARHMSDLVADYDGDETLALVAYNGGPGAVKSAREQLGKDYITGDEWIYAMNIRVAQFGSKDKSAWHVETLQYVQDITGKGWDEDYARWAEKLQGDEPLLYVEDRISGNPALAAINRTAPMPAPLSMRPPSTPTNG